MKKIYITFLVLISFVCILILPIFLGLHASVKTHHGMSASDCIEHCISSQTYLHTPKILSLSHSVEVFLVKILFSHIFEVVVPLVLLYVVCKKAPPNVYHKIKNYNYSCLTGIVKLTT